jgi:hypothetical protein
MTEAAKKKVVLKVKPVKKQPVTTFEAAKKLYGKEEVKTEPTTKK